MKKLLLATTAISLWAMAGPALAADWPVRPLPPAAVLVPAFTWSSCYLGGSVGYGTTKTDITDPTAATRQKRLCPCRARPRE